MVTKFSLQKVKKATTKSEQQTTWMITTTTNPANPFVLDQTSRTRLQAKGVGCPNVLPSIILEEKVKRQQRRLNTSLKKHIQSGT